MVRAGLAAPPTLSQLAGAEVWLSTLGNIRTPSRSGWLIKNELGLGVHCNQCDKFAVLDPASLSFALDVPVPSLGGRFKCSRCGSTAAFWDLKVFEHRRSSDEAAGGSSSEYRTFLVLERAHRYFGRVTRLQALRPLPSHGLAARIRSPVEAGWAKGS